MTVDVDFDPLAESVFIRFLYSKVTHTYTHTPCPYSSEENHSAQPTFKEWGVTLTLLEGRVST